MVSKDKFIERFKLLLSEMETLFDFMRDDNCTEKQLLISGPKYFWNGLKDYGITEEEFFRLIHRFGITANLGIYLNETDSFDDPYPYAADVKIIGFRYENHIAKRDIELNARLWIRENEVEVGKISVNVEDPYGSKKKRQRS